MASKWDINKVVLVGRAANDVDFRKTEGGFSIAKFAIAVNGKPKQDGTDNVSFFDVTAWGRTAEICRDYLVKGQLIAVDGHLEQQRWTNQEGAKRSKIIISVERIELLGGRPGSQGGGNNNQQNNATSSRPQPQRSNVNDEYYDNSDYDDTGFDATPVNYGNDDNDEVPF